MNRRLFLLSLCGPVVAPFQPKTVRFTLTPVIKFRDPLLTKEQVKTLLVPYLTEMVERINREAAAKLMPRNI